LAQHLEVVRDGGLGEVEQRHELAYADLPRVTAQHVDELEPHGVAEGLGDRGHPLGVVALHVGVHDGLAARLAGGPLGLRGQLQIDRHPYTYID
jgi:hypothetical protein